MQPKPIYFMIAFALTLGLGVTAVVAFGGCIQADSEDTGSVGQGVVAESTIQTDTFPVDGMTCAACETTLKIALNKLDGVAKVQTSTKKKQVVVNYDPNKVKAEAIVAAIDKAGYKGHLPAKQK